MIWPLPESLVLGGRIPRIPAILTDLPLLKSVPCFLPLALPLLDPQRLSPVSLLLSLDVNLLPKVFFSKLVSSFQPFLKFLGSPTSCLSSYSCPGLFVLRSELPRVR